MRWHHFGTTAPEHPSPGSACCRPAGVDGALFPKGVNWNWVDMRDHQLVIIIFHLFHAEFFFQLYSSFVSCHIYPFYASLFGNAPVIPSPLSVSFTVRHLNGNSSKKHPRGWAIAVEWGVSCGSEMARAISKCYHVCPLSSSPLL